MGEGYHEAYGRQGVEEPALEPSYLADLIFGSAGARAAKSLVPKAISRLKHAKEAKMYEKAMRESIEEELMVDNAGKIVRSGKKWLGK